MPPIKITLPVLILLCALLITTAETKQKRSKDDESIQQNEIDDRIHVPDVYKTLLQTSTRFALAHTKLSKHVDLDTAMDVLSSAGYMLSKPSVLIKTVEAAAVGIVIMLAITFLSPNSYKLIESAWRDPANTFNLDRYLSNGLTEKSVLATIGSKTEDVLARVGLQAMSCQERSICYVGEMINCTFPKTAETLSKFAQDHFPNSGIKDYRLAKAFISGFTDRNCTKLPTDGGSQSCLSNFFSAVLVPKNRNK